MQIYLPSIKIYLGFFDVVDITLKLNTGIICIISFDSNVVVRDLYKYSLSFNPKGPNLLFLLIYFDMMKYFEVFQGILMYFEVF